MKPYPLFSFMHSKLAFCTLFLLAVGVSFGAPLVISPTLVISPSAVSNGYSGTVTLQINGLTNSESVILENYYDRNGNGVIDSSDILFQALYLTDGKWSTIGGVPNINVPGDLTGIDGSITCPLSMMVPEPQMLIGTHLIRLSSPTGNFTPVITPFVITNDNYSQTVSGSITCNSTNVPYSGVVALTQEKNSDGSRYIAGIGADANGHYSLSLPPGTYMLIAFCPGYVFDASSSSPVVLDTNSSVVNSLTLIPATQVLSGQVLDAGNTNQGLPGVFMTFESASGAFAIGTTDLNGNFSVGVRPDLWKVGPDSSALAPLGYIEIQEKPRFDTTVGAISNALITIPKGTSMFYGYIKDETNAPLVGVSFYNDSLTNGFESSGWSASNGMYCALTIPGTWRINVDNNSFIGENYVLAGSTEYLFTNSVAIRVDFHAAHSTTSIGGNVKDTSGAPVAGLSVYSNFETTYPYQAIGKTDANGNFQLGAIAGKWHVGLSYDNDSGLRSLGYASTGEQIVSVGQSGAIVNFVVYPYGTPTLHAPMKMGPGQIGFQMDAASGFNYYVQVSTNLALPNSWSTILTTNASQDFIFIQDSNATNSQRFYRAVRF